MAFLPRSLRARFSRDRVVDQPQPTYVSSDPPRVQLNEIGFSPSMNFHSPSSVVPDPSSPSQPASSPTSAPRTANRTSSEQDTPTRQPRPTAVSRVTSPAAFDHEQSNMLATRESPVPGSPLSESDPAWSSAVGRATVGGKSGRVIEQLMAVNDKLNRDVKLSEAKLEEQIRTGESARTVHESIQARNQNLQTMVDSQNSAAQRRERKLTEMKEELEAEQARRESAERQMKEIGQERDACVEEHNKNMAHEREIATKATSSYEVMSISWAHREEVHARQVRKLQAEIQSLRAREKADKERFVAMEVVTAQLRADGDIVRHNYKKVLDEFEQYKAGKEESLRAIVEKALRNDTVNDGLAAEMKTVLGEMKHLMNVKRDVKVAE